VQRDKSLVIVLIAASTFSRLAWAGGDNACAPPKDGEGLAIISGTLPEPQVVHGFPSSFTYSYNTHGASFLTKKALYVQRMSMLVKVKSDFPDVFGKLYVLHLRAGTYEFLGWDYGDQPGLLGPKRYRQALGIHPLPFTVKAGRAVYVGSFEPELYEGINLFHQKVVEPWVFVRDRHLRDVGALAEKCPGFDVDHLDIEVMDTTPWVPPKK
jgi:hypothetical protein